MKEYFDASFFSNPLSIYFEWLRIKIYYQIKYWGNHLRIGYNSFVARVSFGKYNYIGKNVYLVDCNIGDFTYISNDSTITNTNIGKFCSIGPNVKFAPGKHPTSKFVSTHPSTFSNPNFIKKKFTSKTMFEGNAKVSIGNDVWVGANCVIIDGITVGDGAIVAANSVVTKNVESYNIVGGTPAKFIKKRFEDYEIEKLIMFKWWNKSEDWIKENIEAFWDIKKFIDIE